MAPPLDITNCWLCLRSHDSRDAKPWLSNCYLTRPESPCPPSFHPLRRCNETRRVFIVLCPRQVGNVNEISSPFCQRKLNSCLTRSVLGLVVFRLSCNAPVVQRTNETEVRHRRATSLLFAALSGKILRGRRRFHDSTLPSLALTCSSSCTSYRNDVSAHTRLVWGSTIHTLNTLIEVGDRIIIWLACRENRRDEINEVRETDSHL